MQAIAEGAREGGLAL
ncbi:hypothetical protein [Burkholderia multivorans]